MFFYFSYYPSLLSLEGDLLDLFPLRDVHRLAGAVLIWSGIKSANDIDEEDPPASTRQVDRKIHRIHKSWGCKRESH